MHDAAVKGEMCNVAPPLEVVVFHPQPEQTGSLHALSSAEPQEGGEEIRVHQHGHASALDVMALAVPAHVAENLFR